MKKILILLVTICCCGCSNVETKATATDDTTKIKYYRNDLAGCIYTIEVEGHLYIALDEGHGAMKIFILDKFGYVGNVAKLRKLNYNKIFVENLSIYTDILLI